MRGKDGVHERDKDERRELEGGELKRKEEVGGKTGR